MSCSGVCAVTRPEPRPACSGPQHAAYVSPDPHGHRRDAAMPRTLGPDVAAQRHGASRVRTGPALHALLPRQGPRDDLVSVLGAPLKTIWDCEQWIADAEAAGDQELADDFPEVQDGDREEAAKAKRLLAVSTGRPRPTWPGLRGSPAPCPSAACAPRRRRGTASASGHVERGREVMAEHHAARRRLGRGQRASAARTSRRISSDRGVSPSARATSIAPTIVDRTTGARSRSSPSRSSSRPR